MRRKAIRTKVVKPFFWTACHQCHDFFRKEPLVKWRMAYANLFGAVLNLDRFYCRKCSLGSCQVPDEVRDMAVSMKWSKRDLEKELA